MIRHILASALFAGAAAGLIATALQLVFVVPLILEAELYESGEIAHFAGPSERVHSHEDAADSHPHSPAGEPDSTEASSWAMPRTLGTVLSGILTFCGFGLLLVAGFAAAGRMGVAVNGSSGILWGLAGFAAIQFAPAMGLAPELPGSGAAALEARQIWWLGTAVASAAGLGLMFLTRTIPLRVLGLVLLALPHVFGAPHPQSYAGVVPPELAALFAARSLGVGVVAWVVLGAAAGYLWARAPAALRPVPV